jgi:hypothetical protein
MREYKYKGSEIDRKFSINNLKRTIQQQAEKPLLQPSISRWKKLDFDHELSQNKLQQSSKENIVEQLLKPEEFSQQLPPQWTLEKKRKKKKSKGLHL